MILSGILVVPRLVLALESLLGGWIGNWDCVWRRWESLEGRLESRLRTGNGQTRCSDSWDGIDFIVSKLSFLTHEPYLRSEGFFSQTVFS